MRTVGGEDRRPVRPRRPGRGPGRWLAGLLLAVSGLASCGEDGGPPERIPPSLEFLGQFATSGVGDVSGSGDLAAVAGRFAPALKPGGPVPAFHPGDAHEGVPGGTVGTVLLVDLSDPRFPELAAVIEDAGFVQDVKVADGVLYATNETGGPFGVSLYEVSDPRRPRLLSRIADPRINPGGVGVHNVAVHRGHLYMVSDDTGTCFVADVRDPLRPRLVAEIDPVAPRGFVHDVAALDDRLYLAWWSAGFYVYDISDPSRPRQLASHAYPGAACHNVWPSADHRLLATTDEKVGGHLRVFDLSDLGAIRQLGEAPVPDAIIHNVVLSAGFAYAAHYTAGLLVWDLLDPARPQQVFHHDANAATGPGFAGAWGVHVERDRVLVSDLEQGLLVYGRD